MKAPLITLATFLGSIIIAAPLSAQDSDKGKGASFSIGHTLSNLGTTEETTRTIDGATITYPVDEEDVVSQLLPAISWFRERRRTQAPHEIAAVKSVLEAPEFKTSILDTIRKLLGVEELSEESADIYNQALQDIDALTRQWIQWSGDTGDIHIYNQATVAPHRFTEDFIKFDQIEYRRNQETGFQITLNPPFIRSGTGIGVFDPDNDTVAPFTLDIFNGAPPGTPAETILGDLKQFLDLVFSLQEHLASEAITEIAAQHLIETLLLHEIESQFFSAPPPRSITRGLARFYLFAHQLNARGQENFQTPQFVRLLLFDVLTDPDSATKRLSELENLSPLESVPEEHEEAVSRFLCGALIKHAQVDGYDLPVFQLFQEKDVQIPENGFSGESFAAALLEAYPEFQEHLATTRENLLNAHRNLLDRESNDPQEHTATTTDAVLDRESKEIGGTTFTYPPPLQAAVAELAPAWAEGLRKVEEVLRSEISDDLKVAPPVILDKETLDSIEALGIPAPRETADHFSRQVAFINNIPHLFVHMFDGNEVHIWLKNELLESLASGAELDGFSFDPEGESLNFNFAVKTDFPSESTVDDFVDALADYPPPAIPVIVDGIANPAQATLEELVTAIKEGDPILAGIIEAAEESALTPDKFLKKPIRVLTEEQSFFLIVHELAETGLMTDVIASENRRWFCDGLANVIAIRECDRHFENGAGMKTFKSLFPPKNMPSLASQVNLLEWPAALDPDNSIAEVDGLEVAYYYFATLALLTAVESQDDAFLADWIAKIRETSWNRTNAETVINAYNELTGKDLRKIVVETTQAPAENGPEEES